MLSPARARGRTLLGRLLLVLACLALVAGGAGAAIHATSGPEPGPGPGPEPQFQLAAAEAPTLPTSCVGPGELIPTVATRCELMPHIEGAPTVVLWGDSHAWQLIPALRAAIGTRQVNLVGFVFGSCPVADPHFVTDTQRARAGECPRTNDMALRYVREAMLAGDDLRVVVTEGWELYRDALARTDGEVSADEVETPTSPTIAKTATLGVEGTPRLFTILAKLKVPVDVVAPMPMVPANAPACADGDDPYACDLPRASALKDESANLASIARLMADLRQPSTLIDPSQALCDTTRCASVLDGQPVYFDDLHVSAQVSTTLAPYFRATVSKVVAASRR